MEPYVAVAVQNAVTACATRAGVIENIEHCIQLVEKNAMGFERRLGYPVKLVSFPEYCFSDWRAVTSPWWDSPVDPLDACIQIPGKETDLLAALAKKLNIFISGHALEVKPELPGLFFNCGFIIDPDGNLIYSRNKTEHGGHLMYASPHDILDRYMELYSDGRSVGETLYPVADTAIGRLGMCMCYEVIVPEIHRQLVSNGAEVILRPTAEMNMFQNEPTEISPILDRARAVENAAYYIVPQLGPAKLNAATHDWAGTSRIISYDGRVLAQAGTTGETLVGAIIDIDRLRHVRTRGQTYLSKSVPIDGTRRLPLYRPETYDYHMRSSYPPNQWSKGPQTREEKQNFIRSLDEPGV